MKDPTTIAFSVLALSFAVLLGGCNSSADERQAEETAELMAQANKEVGMPGITRFTEKRMFKRILEQRDQAFQTYTYYLDLQGDPHLLCESIGYGLPAATQYTNPERDKGFNDHEGPNMPQPDPNGLFMPTSTSATYVLCADSASADGFDAQYVEPAILVTTRPMGGAAVGNSLE